MAEVVTESEVKAKTGHISKVPLNERPFGKAFNSVVKPEKVNTEVPPASSEGGEVPVKAETAAKVEVSKEETKSEPTSLLNSFAKASGLSTPPVVETPVETVPSDKDKNFSELRKSKEALEARVKELEGKVPTDYETTKNEYQKLQERNKLVESELKKVALEKTPDFQEKYDKKISAKVGTIERALIGSEADAKTLVEALKQPDSRARNQAISDTIESLDPVTKAKVVGAIAEFDSLRESREAELANPDPTLKLQQEQMDTQRKMQIEQTVKLLDDTLIEAEASLPWMKEGEDPAWNSAVKEIKDQARHIWTQPMTPKQQSEVALKAAMLPKVYGLLTESYKEMAAKDEIIAKLRGATPQNSANKPPVNGAETPKGKGSFMAKFNAAVNPKS